MAASEKQLSYINSLYTKLNEIATGLDPNKDAAKVSEIGEKLEKIKPALIKFKGEDDLSKAEVQSLIEVLKDITDPFRSPIRWFKHRGEWVVSGPSAIVVEGATVTVSSKKGEQEVIIGKVVATVNGHNYGKPKNAEVGAKVTEPGFYHSEKFGIVEAYNTKKGFLVARTIQENGKKGEYLGMNGLAGLGEKFTLEEAKAFGRETGTCMCCGAELTNPASIEDGIGAICASKMFGGY